MNRVEMGKGMTAKRERLIGVFFVIFGVFAIGFCMKDCVGAFISYNASDWTNKGIVKFKGVTIGEDTKNKKYLINCTSEEGYDYTEHVDYDTYIQANSDHYYYKEHDVYTKKNSKDYYVASGTNTNINSVVWEMRKDKVGNNLALFPIGLGFILAAIYEVYSAKKTERKEREVAEMV